MTRDWRQHPAEMWWQDLNDLIANERVRVVIEAREWTEIDAELHVERRGEWENIAGVIGAESLDDALTELMANYAETVRMRAERGTGAP